MIYLVRHGRTAFNMEGRAQGRLDSPLIPLGIEQARAVARRLRDLVDAGGSWTIETSPLGRARATAEIIREELGAAVPLAIDERLREVSLGSWEGLSGSEIDEQWPGLRLPSLRMSWAMTCPDGETYEEALARAADWLWSRADAEANVIAISHGITGSLIRGLYEGLPKDDMLDLPIPQDAIFALDKGHIERIDCSPEQRVRVA